ncbi:hypothetical protein C8R47DRAFT_1162532 [Mycena vitilis]|nr:hypothetical protein C8R47DRAFT_1162532 [Mycena vitilis]
MSSSPLPPTHVASPVAPLAQPSVAVPVPAARSEHPSDSAAAALGPVSSTPPVKANLAPPSAISSRIPPDSGAVTPSEVAACEASNLAASAVLPTPSYKTKAAPPAAVSAQKLSSSGIANPSVVASGKTSKTILAAPHTVPNFDIPKTLLEEYVRDASKSDETEHQYFTHQLESQLIFAGIFSAIVVQLIPQTYPLLQVPNPSTSAIAINVGLFGSLITSLCTAIMSLQCKAWLDGYQPYRLGHCDTSSQDAIIQACRIRQYRYGGLVKYKVLYAARSAGPTLIYASFVLFFLALVVFLLELHLPTALAIIVFLGLFLVGHGLTSIIPCFTTEAPYKTPLSATLEALYRGARTGQIPNHQLSALAEIADVRQQRARIDTDILTWLATSARHVEIQEEAEAHLLQVQKQLLIV